MDEYKPQIRNHSFIEFVSYLPLALIIVGTIGNSIIFLVFRFSKKFKYMTSMIYLSFISITDTISLYEWNLNHFLLFIGKNWLEEQSEFMCRFTPYFQFFSLHASAFLLSFMTIDRYFTVSCMPGTIFNKMPFRTRKSAYFWSIILILCSGFINVHILFIPRTYKNILKNITYENFTSEMLIDCYVYTTGYKLFPDWERVHLIFYSVIPFLIMTIFNGLLIKNTLCRYFSKSKSTILSINSKKSLRKKQMITISLVFVSVFYLVTTSPATIVFAYLYDFFYFDLKIDVNYFTLLDNISFTNNSCRIFVLLVSNSSFRSVIYKFLCNFFSKVTYLF